MAKHGLFDAAFQQAISVCYSGHLSVCLSVRSSYSSDFMSVYAVSKALGDSVKALRGETTGFLLELQQRGSALAEELTAARAQLDRSSQTAQTVQAELRSLAKQSRAAEQACTTP